MNYCELNGCRPIAGQGRKLGAMTGHDAIPGDRGFTDTAPSSIIARITLSENILTSSYHWQASGLFHHRTDTNEL